MATTALSCDPKVIARQNRLLAALSGRDLERLWSAFQEVVLERGEVLNAPGNEIEHVYFPCAGIVALMVTMSDGRGIETAAISREGVVNAMAGLGLQTTTTRAVVQVPGIAFRISVHHFREAVRDSAVLRDLIVWHTEMLLGQVQITGACNALHSLERKLARSILQIADRTDGDTVPLTQDQLSKMLGVRRSSINLITRDFQDREMITCGRGAINILDRPRLEAEACECYALAKARTAFTPRWTGRM